MTRQDFFELKNLLKEILEKISVKNENIDKVLTAKEVKSLLKCGDTSLGNYRKNGTLPATKIGGRYYYPVEEINKLISLNSLSIAV